MVRSRARGKLNPRHIDPYEVVEQSGVLDNHLALPNSLEKVHDIFHVSQWKHYILQRLMS